MKDLYRSPALKTLSSFDNHWNVLISQYTELTVEPADCGNEYTQDGENKQLTETHLKLPLWFESHQVSDYVSVMDIKANIYDPITEVLVQDVNIRLRFVGSQALKPIILHPNITDTKVNVAKPAFAALGQGSIIYRMRGINQGYRIKLEGQELYRPIEIRITGPDSIKKVEIIDRNLQLRVIAPQGCTDESEA